MSLFEEVDPSQEAAILATERKSKSTDYTIRTVTHWLTLPHKFGFCTVPSHYDNVPDTDYKGEKYDKYPSRLCVDIDGYTVCRWCYVAEADQIAKLEGIKPVLRTENDSN